MSRAVLVVLDLDPRTRSPIVAVTVTVRRLQPTRLIPSYERISRAGPAALGLRATSYAAWLRAAVSIQTSNTPATIFVR